jgi:hypothetical protein
MIEYLDNHQSSRFNEIVMKVTAIKKKSNHEYSGLSFLLNRSPLLSPIGFPNITIVSVVDWRVCFTSSSVRSPTGLSRNNQLDIGVFKTCLWKRWDLNFQSNTNEKKKRNTQCLDFIYGQRNVPMVRIARTVLMQWKYINLLYRPM